MNNPWTILSYDEERDTYETLHLWTQVVGKIKLAHLPWRNHSWHVTLHLTSQGLDTNLLFSGDLAFQIEFNFVSSKLIIRTSNGATREVILRAVPVAIFYSEVMEQLRSLGIEVRVNTTPNEIESAIPFEDDYKHTSYNPEHARRLHQALLRIYPVLTVFQSKFIGKSSPVHFFWGSFDLAVSRFSGRRAPKHPGGVPNLPDWVAEEAYSHEVCSAGFWPGGAALPHAAFYSYIYPEPAGYSNRDIRPEGAYYHEGLGEFILPYEVVRNSENPEDTLMEFLESTYAGAAELAAWDRAELERKKPFRPHALSEKSTNNGKIKGG